MPTTAPTVKVNLLTAIKARAEFATVQATHGYPGEDIETEWLMLGAIDYTDTAWAQMGNKAREEAYSITCVINIRQAGASEKEAEARAFALYAGVEAALKASVSPGPAGVIYAEVVPKRAFGFPYDRNGYEYQIEASLRVKARI